MAAVAEWFVEDVFIHRTLLHNFFAKRARPHHDIEDLCQETYVRILITYAPGEVRSPKGLLFKTARGLLVDLSRRERLMRAKIDRFGPTSFRQVTELDPERLALAFDNVRALREAFAQLPPGRRQVLWMKKVDSLPIKDIARRLNIAPHTVEQNIRKGMRQVLDLSHA